MVRKCMGVAALGVASLSGSKDHAPAYTARCLPHQSQAAQQQAHHQERNNFLGH